MNTPVIELSKGVHRGKPALLIRFSANQQLEVLLKNIHDVHWSANLKCWFTPFNRAHVDAVKLVMKNAASVTFKDEPIPDMLIIDKNDELNYVFDPGEIRSPITRFRIWLEHRGYRERTIEVYLNTMYKFEKHIHPLHLRNASNEHYVSYAELLKKNNKYSSSYRALQLAGIRMYFKVIHGINIDKRERKNNALPKCSHEEIMRMIACVIDLKYRCMLLVMYSCGLQVKELLTLKPSDIKSSTNEVLVVQSAQPRNVPISNSLLVMLRLYFKQYKPLSYLFEGNETGKPCSENHLLEIARKAAAKAGILHEINFPSFRLTLAEHLMSQGTSLAYVMEFLGHQQGTLWEINHQEKLIS